MLYLGIDFACNYVAITALSEGFAFLDELIMYGDDYSTISHWLKSLRLNDDESISWFFCEKKILAWRGPLFFFDLDKGTQHYFMVKDRVIENIYKIFSDMFAYHKLFPEPSKTYLLAAARAFVDDAHIICYNRN